MIPRTCSEMALDRDCRHHVCAEDAGHDGHHVSTRGYGWESPKTTLERLRERWDHTHRIAWTGSYWVATARDRRAGHRTEIEPTPELLERELRRHTGLPPVPAQWRPR